MRYGHRLQISRIAGMTQTTHVTMAGKTNGCAAFTDYAKYRCLSVMNPCCHLSSIDTSNTSCFDPWVLPFICMSFMVRVSVGATSMPVACTNMTQPIRCNVIREKASCYSTFPIVFTSNIHLHASVIEWVSMPIIVLYTYSYL